MRAGLHESVDRRNSGDANAEASSWQKPATGEEVTWRSTLPLD